MTRLSTEEMAVLADQFKPEYHPMLEVISAIGIEAAQRLMLLFGGEKLHVPTPEIFWERLKRETRNQEIFNRYTGRNIAQLAEEYELSRQSIYKIVNSFGRQATPFRGKGKK